MEITKLVRRGETLVSRTEQSKGRNNWAVRKQPRGTLINHQSITQWCKSEMARAKAKTKMRTWSNKLMSDIRGPMDASVIQYELGSMPTNNLGLAR